MAITRPSTPREREIGMENKWQLAPLDQKRCTRCEQVYQGIAENFDIHHKKKDGTYSYAGQCKTCLAAARAARSSHYKTDIALYTKRFMSATRCRAKQDGLDFDLTPDFLVDLWHQQEGKCYYSGREMDLLAATPTKTHPHVMFPSLDKKIPEKGYVQGNVCWTLYGVNRMKNDFTEQQFLEFCKIVTERFSG